MGWNQFSQVVKPADQFEPLPLEAILQGNKAMYERGEKNFTKLQGLIDNAYNLPSLQGKDTEVKNQIIQSYMNNVSQLAKGNLADAKTNAQIEGYINRITRDPQITGIVERATTVANMSKEEKEARLKGQKYYNKGLFEAQRYINDGVYLEDKRFTNRGGLAPDEAEILKKVKETANVTAQTRTANGQITTTKEVLEKEGQDLYKKIAESNPNYRDYYRTMWEEQNYDKAPEDIYEENISPLYNQLLQNSQNIQTDLSTKKLSDIERANLLSRYQSNNEQILQLEELRDNPNTVEELKDLAFNRQLQQSSNDAVKAITGIQDIDVKTDQIYVENLKHRQKLIEDREKQILQLELESGISRATPDFISIASKKVQENKLKNAQATNPNYKIVGSDVALDYKDTDWEKNVFVTDNKGKVKIPNNDNAKQMVVDLIKANPNDFPEIPASMLDKLTFKDIEVTSTGVEIDDSKLPFGNTPQILTTKLKQVKNRLYKPEESTVTNPIKTEIKLPTGQNISPDTVAAIKEQLFSLGKDTSDESVIKIYNKKYNNGK